MFLKLNCVTPVEKLRERRPFGILVATLLLQLLPGGCALITLMYYIDVLYETGNSSSKLVE